MSFSAVLPKFSLTITPPDFVLKSQRSFAVTLEPRYTFGKPVRGILRMTIEPQYKYYRGEKYTMTSSEGQSFTVSKVSYV